LDKNWKESRREEERLRKKKESNGASALRSNNPEIQRQLLPRPQVWPRRQEMPQQWVPTESAPIEGVERTNTVMARP